jgi:hypothetical protein
VSWGEAPAIIDGMSEGDENRNSFEQALRAIADEVERVMDRVSEVDLDEIVRSTGADPDRARRWFDEAGEWLRAQADSFGGAPGAPADSEPVVRDERPASRPAADEDALHGARPHPLDTPTAEQGAALAALDSGRWRLEPGTSALTVAGDGPGPSDALGLVRELRVRDWIGADGAITLAGRHALERWLQAAARG